MDRSLGGLLDHLEALGVAEDTLIFAHGGLIRAVVGLVDAVPHDEIGLFKVANTEVLVRDVPRGAWGELYRGLQ